MQSQEKNQDVNGDSPQNKDGVEPMDDTQPVAAPMGGKTYEEHVNTELNQAIKDQIQLIDPKIFEGVVEELAQLLQEFKDQLPVFQLLQFTQPTAYQSILNIVNTLTTLSQLMIQNGDLPTDHDVVSDQAQEQITQQMQAEGQGGSPAVKNQDAPKASRSDPVGTLRANGAGGRMRIKGSDGQWHYVSQGFKGSVAGSNQGPGPQ